MSEFEEEEGEMRMWEATLSNGKKVRIYARSKHDAEDVVDSFAGEIPINVEALRPGYEKG